MTQILHQQCSRQQLREFLHLRCASPQDQSKSNSGPSHHSQSPEGTQCPLQRTHDRALDFSKKFIVRSTYFKQLREADADSTIGCIVITGSKKSFAGSTHRFASLLTRAAGADIKEMATQSFQSAYQTDMLVPYILICEVSIRVFSGVLARRHQDPQADHRCRQWLRTGNSLILLLGYARFRAAAWSWQ